MEYSKPYYLPPDAAARLEEAGWQREFDVQGRNILISPGGLVFYLTAKSEQVGSYVYVIGSDDESQPVKIGVSTNVAKRLKAFQTGHCHHDELKILAVAPGSPQVETCVKKSFRQWRVRGEVFKRASEIKDFITFLNSGLPVPLALARLFPHLQPELDALCDALLPEAERQSRKGFSYPKIFTDQGLRRLFQDRAQRGALDQIGTAR